MLVCASCHGVFGDVTRTPTLTVCARCRSAYRGSHPSDGGLAGAPVGATLRSGEPGSSAVGAYTGGEAGGVDAGSERSRLAPQGAPAEPGVTHPAEAAE